MHGVAEFRDDILVAHWATRSKSLIDQHLPSFTVLEARASFASRKLRFMLSVVR
jgi:hypothetical protein